ncbi:unnamed protein product [Larinioides sclopetarius]|uniref:Uncharacterized protein n=1 Tax=Larinioides sclopetarius TaxID=280406 RepID=A0AAV1Z492_9ARAC
MIKLPFCNAASLPSLERKFNRGIYWSIIIIDLLTIGAWRQIWQVLWQLLVKIAKFGDFYGILNLLKFSRYLYLKRRYIIVMKNLCDIIHDVTDSLELLYKQRLVHEGRLLLDCECLPLTTIVN